MNTAATIAFEDMSAIFGAGTLFYYNLLIMPPPGVPVLSPQYFKTTNAVINRYIVKERKQGGRCSLYGAHSVSLSLPLSLSLWTTIQDERVSGR